MINITFVFGIGLLLFIFLFRTISQRKEMEINSLHHKQLEVQEKYDFLASQKKALTAELAQKEEQLATLKNNTQGLKPLFSDGVEFQGMDETERISRYLLSSGKITLEQNERALNKMEILKLDFLGVCVALGFIDLETSKQALKANKTDRLVFKPMPTGK